MVGKGVLLECLDDASITEALVINRSSLQMEHPKLKELLLEDFTQLDSLKDQLKGYDACFYCMGVSSIGMNEAKFTAITYDITVIFADLLHELNPNMVFNYVSGTGTDSTATGRVMWARVKGKTENYVLNKGFKDAYAFRPGMIIPERGIKSSTGWYNAVYVVLRPFFGLLKKMKCITTTSKIGYAMIASFTADQLKKHLENKDINAMADSRA